MKAKNYTDRIQNCKISRKTAGFIACKKELEDFYTRFGDAIAELYGADKVDSFCEQEEEDISNPSTSVISGSDIGHTTSGDHSPIIGNIIINYYYL